MVLFYTYSVLAEHCQIYSVGTNHASIIPNGENFTCIIDVKNTSKQRLTINLTGVIKSMQYTGQDKMLVKRQKFEKIQIEAGTSMFILM